MSEQRNLYDIAVIKQIVASKSNVVDRVTQVLCPGAPIVEEIRRISRRVLGSMFRHREITCPQCGAGTEAEAEARCTGSGCPITE